MKKHLIAMIFLIGWLNISNAYDLDGSMGSAGDGARPVTLTNGFGQTFHGVAEGEDDGELRVKVTNNQGDTFEGWALDNSNGGYVLNLENDDTGEMATGTLNQ